MNNAETTQWKLFDAEYFDVGADAVTLNQALKLAMSEFQAIADLNEGTMAGSVGAYYIKNYPQVKMVVFYMMVSFMDDSYQFSSDCRDWVKIDAMTYELPIAYRVGAEERS